MNRKLILIENCGTMLTPAPGTTKDIEDYKTFFQSNCGGAWEDKEIIEFSSKSYAPFDAKILKCFINLYKEDGCEYFLIVFCGHGGMTENGETIFELRPGNDCSLTELKAMLGTTKFMLIADSCRAIEQLEEGGPMPRERLFCDSDKDQHHRDLCQEYYNQAIQRTPEGSCIICFAAGYNETAQDMGRLRGGLFSQSLLDAVPLVHNDLEKELATKGSEYIYTGLPKCVKIAARKVKYKSNDKQHPQCIPEAGGEYLPFIICPNYQLLLED